MRLNSLIDERIKYHNHKEIEKKEIYKMTTQTFIEIFITIKTTTILFV